MDQVAGFIETWGRGIEKICEACRKDMVPLPEYSIHLSDIMVKFTTTEDRIIKKGTEKVTEKVTEKAGIRYKNILHLISKDAFITTSKIANELDVSSKTIKADMANLKNRGILERIGAARGGYWKIIKHKN